MDNWYWSTTDGWEYMFVPNDGTYRRRIGYYEWEKTISSPLHMKKKSIKAFSEDERAIIQAEAGDG